MVIGSLRAELETLWNVNLMGAFLFNSKQADLEGPLWWNVDFAGFADGTRKKDENNTILLALKE